MVQIMALWLPILLSAVIVFAASSVIHMFLTYHSTDYDQLPNEASVMEGMRNAGVQPGNYAYPWCASMKEMGSSEMLEKYNKGPVGTAVVWPNGPPAMGKLLIQWFVFSLLVGVMVAYMTGRTLSAGEEYWAVFRVAGTVAFLCYGFAQIIESIWWGRKWSTTAKNLFDAFVYGSLTAGSFAGFWPA